MRRAFAVVALVFMSGGVSFGADWPMFRSHHARPKAGCTGYVDDSPLCPQLAPYVFDNSQCRLPWCSDTKWAVDPGSLYFPPLPYGHRAMGSPGPAAAASPH